MQIWDAVPNISLTESEPHHPQFITKSYGTICLYAHMQATEAQLTLCKGITLSHKMSFIHILQRPKAIYVYCYKSAEEHVKAKRNAHFLPYICCLQT